MQTSVKKIEDGVVELSVELDQAELTGYLSGVEKEMASEVEVAGFRKGKVPHDIARKHLNNDLARQSAMEIAVSDSLSRAIREHKFDVAVSENLKMGENSQLKLKYTVMLKVFPEIEIPELAAIHIEKKPTTVTDGEINESLDVIRNMRATFSLKDGAAAIGDRVEVDFEVRLDGELIEGGESKNHPLIIGGKNFMPGFEEQLIGLKVGDGKAFDLVTPADYYVKKIAGKKLNFSVTMRQVQAVNLPELNDEFASKVGNFTNLTQLRENVGSGIKKEKEAKEKERIRLAILDAISTTAKVKAPGFLVEEQLDSMLNSFDRDLHEKGLELPLYLAQIGKSQEELRKDWAKDAHRQAQLMLVLRAVAKKNEIKVTDQEIDNEVNTAVQMLVSRGQADVQNIDLPSVRERIAERMLQEKAFDFLEKECSVGGDSA